MTSGSERQVARNFLALASGEALSRVIAFGSTVYLARVLGADAYGMIALAVSVNLYLSKVADFGIEATGVQEVARSAGQDASPERSRVLSRLVAAILALRFLLTLALCASAVLVVRAVFEPPLSDVLALYFVLLFPIALSTKWVHVGHENARPIGFTRVLGEAIAFALVVLWVQGVSRLWLVPIAQLVGDGIAVLVLGWLAVRAGVSLRAGFDFAAALPVFRRALPLTLQTMLGLVLYNSDIMFLRALRDSENVGYYACAYTLVSFLVNLGAAHATSLLPALTRLSSDAAAEHELYSGALARTFALALPVAVGGTLVAVAIIDTAFGAAYAPSAPVLQLLAWSVVPSTLRSVGWAALVARGRQDLLLRANVYAVVLNLIANYLLISRYGMYGAACATILTEAFVFGIVGLRYAPSLGLPRLPLARFARPLAAAVAMAAVITLTGAFTSLVAGIALGGATYGGALIALGVLKLRRGGLPSLEV